MMYTGIAKIDNAMKAALAAARCDEVELSKEREAYLKSEAYKEDQAFMNMSLDKYLQTA